MLFYYCIFILCSVIVVMRCVIVSINHYLSIYLLSYHHVAPILGFLLCKLIKPEFMLRIAYISLYGV